MNHIKIKHNPFLVNTDFTINGHAPSESSNIACYSKKRLQLWVEQFFFDLKDLFNGNCEFHLEFTGVESDYQDFFQASEKAEQQGMAIDLLWHPITPTEERLEKIKELMKQVQNTPKFSDYLEKSGADVKRIFDEALNNDFDVYVIATMSSGKSTFINAMIGQDLLPAANEATTATIAHIFDDKSRGFNFFGERFNHQGEMTEIQEAINLDTLKEWNQDPDTKTIRLHGDIHAVKENENVRLVLTDTPGPNNSQDENHERTTMGFIQDSNRNPLIIYVLNATQLGTNDDRNLLRLVADIMSKGGKQSKDRFLFVVNKMDMFDPERGENIEQALKRVRLYLQENGIQDPNIYPVSARMAYLLRKQGELTRIERNDKHNIGELLLEEPSMALWKYMPLSSRVTRAIEQKDISRELLNSGLPGVEAVIDEYISKYSFPMRLERASYALNKAIEHGMQEAELKKQLEIDQSVLDELSVGIESLKKRRNAGFKSQDYKDRIKKEGRDLPQETQNSLNETEAHVILLIRELGNTFTDKASRRIAEKRIDDATKEIQFTLNRCINEYEQAFQKSQELIKEELHKEYQHYVASLFSDCRALELPIFKSLKHSIETIAFNIELTDKDVSTRKVVTGYKTVSTSSWYNPFSWGDTKEVPIYGEEKYVDLKDMWNDRLKDIRKNFQNLKESAIQHIRTDKDKLVDNYLAFLEAEFTQRFKAITDDLDQMANNKEQREAAIKQAKIELGEIQELKQKLESILHL